MRGVHSVYRLAKEEGRATPSVPCGHPRAPCSPRSTQLSPLQGPRRAGRSQGLNLYPFTCSQPRPASQGELSPGEVTPASLPYPVGTLRFCLLPQRRVPACGGKPPGASPLLTSSLPSVHSCVPFSIYTPWGERCEHLGMKLGAFFGILFGALFTLLLLGAVGFAVLYFWRFWRYSPGNHYSHRLDSES